MNKESTLVHNIQSVSIFYSTSHIGDVTNVINNELEKLDIWLRRKTFSRNVHKTNVTLNNRRQSI